MPVLYGVSVVPMPVLHGGFSSMLQMAFIPVFYRIPWCVAGTAAVSAVGTGFLMYDVQRKRVYKDQKFSDACRHYMSVNSLAWLGYIFQVGLILYGCGCEVSPFLCALAE